MRFVLALALLAAACGAPETKNPETANAAPEASGSVAVSDAWAPPTPNGVEVSAGFLTMVGGMEADRLLAATSRRAARMEIHGTAMEGSVMQMRRLPALPIAAGETVTLAPGGLHLMFYGVSQPFTVGEDIPVRLTFERAGDIDVVLRVRPPNAGGHDH